MDNQFKSGGEVLAHLAFRANLTNSMTEALLRHYAAFIETQTGVAAAETIAAIKADANQSYQEQLVTDRGLLDALTSELKKSQKNLVV